MVVFSCQEEAPVSKCNENPTFDHSFWMPIGNVNCIKKEEPDTETQYSQCMYLFYYYFYCTVNNLGDLQIVPAYTWVLRLYILGVSSRIMSM